MRRSWIVSLAFVLGCGDGGGDADDDFDVGSDPGPQPGDLEACPVEGADTADDDCILSGGGAFRADFNSDGISDLVVGAPFADVDGVVDAGAVYIYYGGDNFTKVPPQVLTQNMAGSGDQAEPYDRFGWAVSPLDISGRGHSDLVVGVPYEDVGTLVDAGAIQLFTVRNTLLEPYMRTNVPSLWTQDTGDIGDTAEAGDLFGFSIAWGKLRTNTDNFAHDVAIGVPGEDIDGVANAGAVNVLFNGWPLQTSGVFLHQGLAGMNAMLESNDQFGWSVAVSQPNIDVDALELPTYLAIGVPGEDIGSIVDAGSVHVLPPTDNGPTPTGSQAWHQNSPGIAGGCERGDRFGEVLATRRLPDGTASSRPDLLVGVPHEDLTGPDGAFAADAGMVHVIPSDGVGLTATGSRVFSQADTSGSPATETIEAGDRFGAAIAGGKFRGGAPELVIAAPGEDLGDAVNAGVIHYLKLVNGAFAAADASVITIAGTTGHTPASGDAFGTSLSAWEFLGSGGPTQLVVGVPGKDVTVNGTTISNAGAALFYIGTPAGLPASAAKTLTATEGGGTPAAGEQLGRALY